LALRKVKKWGVAVIKLGVNERGYDGASSGKVEGVYDQNESFNYSQYDSEATCIEEIKHISQILLK